MPFLGDYLRRDIIWGSHKALSYFVLINIFRYSKVCETSIAFIV